MNKSIVYTNDKCIGCNKCIKVCSAIGACISGEVDGKERIEVDGSKCVACGSCIDVCAHGAREYIDDTEAFFEDLARGEDISILLAPAFKANYPDEYDSVLGGLKALGVKRIISVSFGADITTWGYLNYIREHDFTGGISQPCPAVVSYIERYLPELLPRLFPVQSPLMCAAIYARREMGIKDRFAFISPCIAKKLEIEDPHNAGLVHYNVTFEHLMDHIRKNDIKGPSAHSEIEYGLGSFYPTPGGLAENVRWFLGDSVFIRQIEGERRLYEWMHQNAGVIKDKKTPFLFIDALNCEKGCICGTAIDPQKAKTDDALYALLDIREGSKKSGSGDAWSRCDTPEQRLENYNRQFAGLKLEDYLREYTDRSAGCGYKIPDADTLDAIFTGMNKVTQESRHIDCTCCGYDSCEQMAAAIYNGFNHKENCIYYEKTMVRELEIEKAIAEETARAKSAFLANMSHEIRTPINAVLGMNEMILRESSEDEIVEYAENVRNAGKTLLGLVNNILDFSRLEAGKIRIIEDEYELRTVLCDLISMIQAKADAKDLEFKTDIDEDIPGVLYGDEVRIKQIISNILTNAVKYTQKGSVTLKVGHEPAEDDSIYLNVTVTDTGIGIKPEDIDRLFVEFERIEEKRNRTIEGTGLGMNITKQLLEMMGSALKVESVYGSGSVFGFSLKQKVISRKPMGSCADTSAAAAPRKEYREKFTAPGASVLVVDDTETNLDVFKSLLKRTGMRIDTADGGEECLEKSPAQKYDIIFLDHMMPGMDGIQTLAELRSRVQDPNHDTPVICLTANAVAGAKEMYLSEGFDDYISKPIDADELEEMLIKYLPRELVVMSDAADEEEEEEMPLPGWLFECGDVDVPSGVKNCGGNAEYMTVLSGFYSAITAKADEIEGYFETGDIRNYTIKVHALKSSARIIGAKDLSERARLLEEAGDRNDTGYIRENTYELLNEYRSYTKTLAPLLIKSDDLPDISEEMLADAYAGLYEFAEAMDYELARMVLDTLKEYRLPPDDTKRIEGIQTCLSQMDWDGIKKIVKAKKGE